VADSALFDSGKADINARAQTLLDGICAILADYADQIQMVRIEGHTDDRPIHTAQFKSNWELSTTRAVNVLKRLLEAAPVGADKLSAVGYGEFHPAADNLSDAGRAQNRRVDFVIETLLAPAEPGLTAQPIPSP
jgi:chemotaxis protein MotB